MGHMTPGYKLVPFLIIMFLVKFKSIVLSCELNNCWTLYQDSQRLFGIRDDYFDLTDSPSVPADQRESYCTVRRTFYVCLRQQRRLCRSDLTFHTLYQGLQEWLGRLDCSLEGRIIDRSEIPIEDDDTARLQCVYNEQQPKEYCAIYGLSHLRTMDKVTATCLMDGSWPLIDNEYLTVQITSTPVNNQIRDRLYRNTGFTPAAMISQVTVLVKVFRHCAARQYVTYQAFDGSLPQVFDTGEQVLGLYDSVQVEAIVPNAQVQITLDHIGTKVTLRYVKESGYSVSIQSPKLNTSKTLCSEGCPLQQVEYSAVKTTPQALKDCTGLKDVYWDNCMYDMVMTGHSMAPIAMMDLLAVQPDTQFRNTTRIASLNVPTVAMATAGAQSGNFSCYLMFFTAAYLYLWLYS